MQPLQHQQDALQDIAASLKSNDRVTCVMACGTGKTLVGLWTVEQQTAQTVLILLPSLSLLRQTLYEWLDNSSRDFKYLCVCSDPTVQAKRNDEFMLDPADLDFPVGTDSEVVSRFLAETKGDTRYIFTTYQSAAVVAAGLPKGFSFDFAVFDEAHKTAGKKNHQFAFALNDKNIPIAKRLFLTATPRIHDVNHRDAEDGAKVACSMDDETIYGPIAHRLPFSKAVKMGIICGYKVLISVVQYSDLPQEVFQSDQSFISGSSVLAKQAAHQIAIKRAVDLYRAKKIITYHGSIEAAAEFTSTGDHGIDLFLPEFTPLHVNGSMKISEREQIMDVIKQPGRRTIISNARCLTEGVDVPAVDMVAFTAPKRSTVDIVQAAGRAMRRSNGKETGYILIPVFLDLAEGENESQAISRTQYRYIWEVLEAMADNDDDLAEAARSIRTGMGQGLGFNGSGLRDKVEVIFSSDVALERLREAIEIKLVAQLTSRFYEMIGRLENFRAKYGHCDVPRNYPHDPQLATWVSNLRHYHKTRRHLNADQIKILSKMGFRWAINQPLENYHNLSELKSYYDRRGHTRLFVKQGASLSLLRWVNAVREAKRGHLLSPDFEAALEKIGFEWEVIASIHTNMLSRLDAFIAKHGHCNVPEGYTDDLALARWVQNKRTQLTKKTANKHLAFLKKELELRGFDFHPKSTKHKEMLSRLDAFIAKHGHCNVPTQYPDDPQLATWLSTRKKAYKRRKLDLQQIIELETRGIDWQPGKTSTEERRRVMLTPLKQFRTKHGHCNVPSIYPPNQELANWCNHQRKNYKKGTLSKDQIDRLEALGFVWAFDAQREKQWDEMYDALAEYKKLTGHCNVPQRYRPNQKLANWCGTQRRGYKNGMLSQDRIDRLEALGFVWDLSKK